MCYKEGYQLLNYLYIDRLQAKQQYISLYKEYNNNTILYTVVALYITNFKGQLDNNNNKDILYNQRDSSLDKDKNNTKNVIYYLTSTIYLYYITKENIY